MSCRGEILRRWCIGAVEELVRVDSVPFSKCADCACMLPTEGTLMVVLAAGAVSGHFIQFSKGTLASKYSASSHPRSIRKNIDAKHTVGRRILLDALKALQCRIQTLSSAIHYFGQACKRCQMTVTGRSHTQHYIRYYINPLPRHLLK